MPPLPDEDNNALNAFNAFHHTPFGNVTYTDGILSQQFSIAPQTSMPPQEKPEYKQLTSDIEKRLEPARERLLVAEYSRGKSSQRSMGRREDQYYAHLRDRKQKDLSVHEIVHSELPLHIESISGRKIEEMTMHERPAGLMGDVGKTPIQFVCYTCKLLVPDYYAFICRGAVYCAEHVPDLELCGNCGYLQSGCKVLKGYDGREVTVCGTCRARPHCRNCPNVLAEAYIVGRRCANCVAATSSNRERPFSHSMRWVSNDTGRIVTSKRVYSCEIEGVTGYANWQELLATSLPHEMGIGHDGSITGSRESPHGFEIQTPRIGGKAGEELIGRATSAVHAIHASVNDTCGMHIHLDGKGINVVSRKEHPTALIQLWKAYIVFEDVILSVLPFSRRRNDYCRPLAQYFQLAELDMVDSIADAEKLWYKERTYNEVATAKNTHYTPTRYFGANFHSLLAHGHFEVRYHSGTLNSTKILQWANLHALIMDAAEKLAFDYDFLTEAQATSRLSEKSEMLFDRIGLSAQSQQYFRERQKKFGDKKRQDEETQKRAKVALNPAVTSTRNRPFFVVPDEAVTFSPSIVEDIVSRWNGIPDTNTFTSLEALEESYSDEE